jgi:hypothetical protein
MAAAWNTHLSKGDCMKSQANAILHVARGIIQDILVTYPELKSSLSKDLDRLTLYCQTRGEGLFTLDLPSLHSLLLLGLDTGRLDLHGPLSRTVSSKTKVPRLFSGLWLRVFDKSSCLKREVDINAIFFLRSLLAIGSKLAVSCSSERVSAKIEEFVNVESNLRKPTLDWAGNELEPNSRRRSLDDESSEPLLFGHLGRYYASNNTGHHLDGIQLSFDFQSSEETEESVAQDQDLQSSLHLAEALKQTYVDFWSSDRLPLFSNSERDHLSYLRDLKLLNTIQKVSDVVFNAIGPFNAVDHSDLQHSRNYGIGFRHGPGAVAERLQNHEKSRFLYWSDKLESFYPYHLCGRTANSDLDRPVNHEPASLIYQVPKTAKGPRLIAAEPTSHQWCQQSALSFLFYRCRSLFKGDFIDFKDQSKSGDMVLEASRKRNLATVDLSDASDRLSCWTIERMIRSNPSLLRAIHSARTRYTKVDRLSYSEFLPLKKFASQGTAVTFPIMSLVMLVIAFASCIDDDQDFTFDHIWKYRTRIRVFGDDIILPTHGYERLCRAMELLQLKVNSSKSYVTGSFRESCGVDGYDGYDITPLRPKTFVANSPASCQAVLDFSNNLFNKGLWYASESARLLLPYDVRKYIPVVGPREAGRTGFTSYVGGDETHLRQRWNRRLHRYEVRVWATKPYTRKSVRSGYDALLDFFTRIPGQSNPRIVSEYVCRRKTRGGLLWEPKGSDPLETTNLSRRDSVYWGEPLFRSSSKKLRG